MTPYDTFARNFRQRTQVSPPLGASAMLTPAADFSGSSQIASYDDAGNPIGTTGGLIPEQESDRAARLQRGASALLPQTGGAIPTSLPPPAAQPGQPTVPAGNPTPASTTMGGANLRTLQTAFGGAPLGASALLADTPEGAETGGVLDLAANIQALRDSSVADRNTRLLANQGALPGANDTPEVRASKLRYADVLLERAATGQDLRIGGLSSGGESDGTRGPQTTAMLADIAQRVVQRGRQPRVVRAGTTASGRPVDVLSLGNGNFSEVRDPQAGETELAKLVRERAAAQQAGNTELVDTYTRAIENFRSGPQERPLSLNEFLVSDSLSNKYQNDYALYREDYNRQSSKVRKPADNSTPEAKARLEAIRQERARRAASQKPAR